MSDQPGSGLLNGMAEQDLRFEAGLSWVEAERCT
jgi:hypothetical protein